MSATNVHALCPFDLQPLRRESAEILAEICMIKFNENMASLLVLLWKRLDYKGSLPFLKRHIVDCADLFLFIE